MSLPFEPPLEPMLAKLAREVPDGDDWLYEPKWDGFRAMIFRDGDRTEVVSRDGKTLVRYFPELLDPLVDALPPVCVLDGEVVVPGRYGLEFDSLLMRIHPAKSRVEKLSKEIPASFVAFDLLALGSDDLRAAPLTRRREQLEECLPEAVVLPSDADGDGLDQRVISALRPGPLVAITPQTDDTRLATLWFDLFEGAGLDGVIAKKADGPYLAGERAMVKVKHVRTADCVIGGYRFNKTRDGIGSLLLGLYEDGVLQYVGHTSSFKAQERRDLLEKMRSYEGGPSFGRGRTPGGPSRWSSGQDKNWVEVRPELVVEVAYDHLQGERFRHATTFQRWRPDKPPEDCTYEQILPQSRRRSG